MSQLFQTWWTAVSSYFPTAFGIFSGHSDALTLLTAAGTGLLVVGVILSLAYRVRQVVWLLVVFAIAALASPVISISNSILGWLGMLFAVVAGALVLFIGINYVAGIADRRLPAWLIGLFILSFATYCAALGGAFLSLAA